MVAAIYTLTFNNCVAVKIFHFCIFKNNIKYIDLIALKVKTSKWPGAYQWRIYNHRMWGQLSTSCVTEVAQCETPSCSRLKSATDNGVRDGRSNWLVATPTLMGSTPWAPRALYKSVQGLAAHESACNLSMRGNHASHARVTQGMSGCIGIEANWLYKFSPREVL